MTATVRGSRRFARLIALVAAIAILMAAGHEVVLADRCGGAATVEPASGPTGTEFVFQTNLGAPSDLTLVRNGRLVGVVPLNGHADVSYTIQTHEGDEGVWVATARVRSAPDCGSEASFTVTPSLGAQTPDGSAGATPSSPDRQGLIVGVAVVVASLVLVLAVIGVLRTRQSERPSR